MFYSDIQNNPSALVKNHLPPNPNSEVHPTGADGFPKSQQLRMPPLNKFNYVRIKPQTNLPGTLFQPGNQVDYYVNSSYTEKLLLELTMNVSTAAVTANLEFCIDRVEIISNGEILSTIRGINLWHAWLFKGYDQTIREASATNKNTSLVAQSIAVGTGYVYYLHLWSLIDYVQPKLNSIKSNFLFRIYFTDAGIVSGSASNIAVVSCDVIAQTQQLSAQLESLESQRKQSMYLHYRFLNPIRALSETKALNPSSDYFFRLTSSSGLVAFVIFHITAVGGAPDTFIQLSSYEFLDENNTIVGIQTPRQLQTYVGEALNGYANYLFPNVYVIPFAYPEMALNGCECGFYKTTTKEQLRIFTPSTLVAGNYLIEAYTYEYNVLNICRGTASVSK